MMRLTIATIIIGAGLSSAQTISSGCQNTLLNMIASPDAQCLNPSALLSLATGSSNSSIISPVNNWLQGLCPLAPCTNSSLAQVVANLTSGCSTELSSLGLSTSNPSQLTSGVQAAYPAARQVACLRNTTANDLCTTELLTSIQSSVGTLTLSSITQIAPNILSGSTKLPQNVTCSDCVKEAYNILQTDFPGMTTSSISSTCGTAFINGTTPTDISESASTASAGANTSKNGAASLFSVSSIVAVTVSSLVAVSSAFVVFA